MSQSRTTVHPAIEERIAVVAGHLNVFHAQLVSLVADALETDDWRGDRIHTPAQWLAWRAGVSPERAQQIVAVAERRRDFPHLIASFERGELTLDQVAVVVTRAPAWADQRVLDFARSATVGQLRRYMRSEHFEGGPTEPQHPEEARDRLSTGHRDNGRWRISGELDEDDGATVDAALSDVKNDLFRKGHADVTNADALVELANRYLAGVPGKSRRDRNRIWYHLDADGITTLTNGWVLPKAVRDAILCDGIVQPVWERDGVPFNVGRGQQIVPERTRRAVMRRDRGCRVPGCTNDRFLDVHHIWHWIKGGPTDTWNLVCLCRRHHRLHHRDRLGISGNADQPNGLVFTNADGRELDASGRPIVPTGPPTRPPKPYEHPEGTPVNRDWLGLGWVHPDEQLRRRAMARLLAAPPPAA